MARLAEVYQCLEAGGGVSGEGGLNRRRDGSLFHGLHWGAPFRDEQGAIIGYMGWLRDISARRQAELALIESEARYRLLAEHSSNIISKHSTDGALPGRKFSVHAGFGGFRSRSTHPTDL